MAEGAKKINFMIDDDIRREFERLVPAGQRSRVVNEALRKELEMIRRARVVDQLISADKSRTFSNQKIVEALKKDRAAH
jgi:hypothetical protein